MMSLWTWVIPSLRAQVGTTEAAPSATEQAEERGMVMQILRFENTVRW